ncbi:MAG: hemerythrin domain-containing protein [Nanoarchaeota archaeon]|nr:hemerythrin domain-containing protein [Nanoarchaeota archaeon]
MDVQVTSLTDLMVIEHARIQEMLEEVNISSYEDKMRALECFNRFKLNIEKHFMIEERAIVQLLNNISGIEVNDTFRLMEEQGGIISMIKKVEDDIAQGDYSKIQDLMTMLEDHSEFENQTFYPNLDKKLSDDRKKEIIEKVSAMIRSG